MRKIPPKVPFEKKAKAQREKKQTHEKKDTNPQTRKPALQLNISSAPIFKALSFFLVGIFESFCTPFIATGNPH
jgi:hypothetical protein